MDYIIHIIDLWKYLLQSTNCNNIFKSIWCRYKNHPCGVWYYTSHGTEPDMRCKDCNDDLG